MSLNTLRALFPAPATTKTPAEQSMTVYLIYAETTPRQREPRDAATDAETRTISDSIDRSLTLVNA